MPAMTINNVAKDAVSYTPFPGRRGNMLQMMSAAKTAVHPDIES
jgi:hypothetical protein